MRTFNGTARRGDGHSYVGRFVPISPAETRTADLDEEGIVLREQNVLMEVSKYKGRK
jgi:hypothetical protein